MAPFLSPQVDKFTIEAVDLGQVFRIKIRHDNSMMSADWYLDQVEVFDEDTEEVFLFLCERWLSRKREDRRIERVFYVKVERSTAVWAELPFTHHVLVGKWRKNNKKNSLRQLENGLQSQFPTLFPHSILDEILYLFPKNMK